MRPPIASNPSAQRNGITVSASGLEHVDATSARVTLRLGSRTNALIYNAAVLVPVVDAMVKAGVDRSSIQLPPNFQAPGNSSFASIAGTVAHPTVDAMQGAVASVGAAIVAIPGAVLQEVQVALRADDCQAQQTRARSVAIAEAQAKAAAIAKQLSVKLGGVVSVSSSDQTQPDGSCANSYSVSPYGPSMDRPAEYLSIPVYSSVTITYAIH